MKDEETMLEGGPAAAGHSALPRATSGPAGRAPGAATPAQSGPYASQAIAGTPLLQGQDFPRAFGAFLLLCPLDKGGMGEVYLAKTGGIAGIDRVCVLKRLKPELVESREYLERFLDEARVVVRLSHPNICHVFDVGEENGQHYLAMEHISGVDLSALLMTLRELNRPLDEGLALAIAGDVLGALDAAHRMADPVTGTPLQLVHRDVSPQNVMITFDGAVKLIDFGLAASTLKREKTETERVMGKIAYMSPEQARGERISAATDQFAAAVMLYELLSGERFYGARSTHQIWQVAGMGGFRPDRLPDIDPELRSLLERALAPWAADRFDSCGDLREAITRLRAARHPGSPDRALRALLEEMCAPRREAERQLLARFADVSAAAVRKADRFSGPQALAAQLPQPALVVVDPSAGLVDPSPPTSETAMLQAAPGRRRGAWAAAVVGGMVVVAAGLFLLRGAGPPVPATADIAAPGIAPGAPTTTPPTATTTTTPTATMTTEVGGEPPLPVAPAAPGSDPAPVAAPARPAPRRASTTSYAEKRRIVEKCDAAPAVLRAWVRTHDAPPDNSTLLDHWVKLCRAKR